MVGGCDELEFFFASVEEYAEFVYICGMFLEICV